MLKTEEQFKNKVRLVYEYDKKSPLFARIANWELESNNTDLAIEILTNGLRQYPDYPTPYFVLGKAYTLSGDFTKALRCYKKGSELLHSSETFEYYTRLIEGIRRQHSPLELRGIGFPDEFQSDDDASNSESDNFSLEDNLGELAERISKAKIPLSSDENIKTNYEVDDFSESSVLVSETLAKIYITQGEINEAISMYEKLKLKHPNQADYYSKRITELKERSDNTTS